MATLVPFHRTIQLIVPLVRYFLNAAYLYERLVRTYSSPPASLAKVNRRIPQHDSEAGETTALLTPEAKEDLEDAVEDFIIMEVYLQRSLIKARVISRMMLSIRAYVRSCSSRVSWLPPATSLA